MARRPSSVKLAMPQPLILHHYPQSPVAEKVRLVLGLKSLSWQSVEIPRLPPKPDLIPLTGGYRRTPVLQIGADIYCDSRRIIQELDRRYPEPPLYRDRVAALVGAVSRWTDGPLFDCALALVLGAAPDTLPADFARDRGRLYFGPDYDLHLLHARLPHYLAQLRAQLDWVDRQLGGGSRYLTGAQPSLLDVQCYYPLWFLRGRYPQGPEFLKQFENLTDWEERMQSLGHGRCQALAAQQALAVARDSESETEARIDVLDPQQLQPETRVTIVPEGRGGDPPVAGEILRADLQEVAIRRSDQRVGDVVVHFPRVGYRIDRT